MNKFKLLPIRQALHLPNIWKAFVNDRIRELARTDDVDVGEADMDLIKNTL
jgi:hypothetical protein